MRASEYEVNPESYTKAFGVYLLYQDITHYKEKKSKKQAEALYLFPIQLNVHVNTKSGQIR